MLATTGKGCGAASKSLQAMVCLTICLSLTAWAWSQNAAGPAAKPKDKSALDDGKPTYVNFDNEYSQLIDEALKLLESDDPESWDFAFEILQTMLTKRESSFYPVEGSSSQFVGLQVKANEVLSKLSPEHLKRYRMLYDVTAKSLFDQAVAGDFNKLHQVVDQYRYTSCGGEAINMLGGVYFDRARFAQAAVTWQLLLASHPEDEAVPLVIAKASIAYHLAGLPAMADKMTKALKDRFPVATAVLAGTKQNLQEFVRQARLIPPESLGGLPDFMRAKHTFPGLGGVPAGDVVMGECDTLLIARWLLAAKEKNIIERSDVGASDLLAMQEAINRQGEYNPYSGRPHLSQSVKFAGGMLRYSPNQPGRSAYLPAAIQPVVVGDMVIYRTSENIIACNLVTGEIIWRKAPFPMQRQLNINIGNYGYPTPSTSDDLGRYTLTVGGGKLFAVGGFRPWIPPHVLNQPGITPEQKKHLYDSSTLAAMSLRAQGALKWQVGNGEGDDDIVRFGKYLTAPTYYSGKVYVQVSYSDSYYMVCLDADNGKLIWKNALSQSPTNANANPWGGGAPAAPDRSGPMAVADGKVFVLTNATAMGAFDAESGQPLWAYQYDIPASSASTGRVYYSPAQSADRSVNPILAIGGRVIFLPTDSNTVFCLSTEDGKPLWTDTATRREQRDLSYIDEDRFLLSGPGMYVMRVADGKEIFGRSNLGIAGRPAVSGRTVLCSSEGRLQRLEMDKYLLSTMDLISNDSILGNLVCVDGILVAANAAGVCAYFNYDQAYQRMSDRIKNAQDPKEKLQLMYDRAQVSFSAKRIPAALQDLLDCRALAGKVEDADMAAAVAPRLYRAYVAMANHATSPAQMIEYIKKAGELAQSDQERALYILRLAKCYRKAGDLKAALSQAQELSDKMPEEPLEDVVVGPEADDTVRQNVPSQRTARSVAQDLIGDMIDSDAKGREAYKVQDDLAKDSLARARKVNDPEAMIAVSAAWPHSLYADEAQYSAAEEYYRQSLKKSGTEEGAIAIGNAMKYLSIAAKGNGKFRTPSQLATALIYKQSGWLAMAQLSLDPLADVDPQGQYTFADMKGKVADLLAQVGVNKDVPPIPDVSTLKMPVDQLFSVPGQSVSILTDHRGNPVRLDNQVLVWKDDRLVLIDTLAKDADNAITWSALSTLRQTAPAQDSSFMYGPQFKRVIAGLSKDKKVIGVTDYETVCGLHVSSAKIAWRKSIGEYGGRPNPGTLAVGQGYMVYGDQQGRVTCIDLSTGELAWTSEPSASLRGMMMAPTIMSGMVLARCNGGKSIVCWNLKTGKILAAIEGKKYAAGMFNTRGFLVTLVDEELSVRDPSNMQRAAWVRKYPGEFAALGSVLGDRVILSRDYRSANELEVVSLISGAVIQKLYLGNLGNSTCAPLLRHAFSPTFVDNRTIMCEADGNVVYITCSRVTGGGMAGFGGPATPGISIQKFDLKNGKRLWQSDIDGEGSVSYVAPTLVVGRAHVMFCPSAALRSDGETNDSRMYVVDAGSGKLATTLDPNKAKNDPPAIRVGLKMLSPAVMTNGRILMENADGVTVYGGGN